MRQQRVNPDHVIARIAARQHGVISYAQLLGAGLSPSGISRRVAMGRLHRIYRGVYAVGHRPVTREAKWIAAVLACGQGAALSHRAAAELWRMLPPKDGLSTSRCRYRAVASRSAETDCTVLPRCLPRRCDDTASP
jgi:Transcriptional regulator, AbiEi antitoxin